MRLSRSLAGVFIGAAVLGNGSHALAQTESASTRRTGTLEEVIVTAERRAVNMQEVPVAVTAVSAEMAAAAGITNVTDLQAVAPAVNWGTGIGGGSVTVRGVSGTGSTGDESANAVYVDGVYQPFSTALLFSFNNIRSIEVDKGPQGTLFGRNASGGAVQVTTRDPSQTTQGDFSLGYGNYETTDAKAYFTTGLSETIAADISGYYSNQDEGWGVNVFNGHDMYLGESYGARTKVKWTPSELTSLTFAYSFNHLEPAALNGPAQVIPGENKPYYGFYNQSVNKDPLEQSIQHNASITFAHDFEFATLKNIVSYDRVDNPLQVDADYGPLLIAHTGADYDTYSRSWTEELQLLSSPSSKVTWVAGFFYFWNMNFRGAPGVGLAFAPSPGVPGTNASLGRSRNDSYASYVQATVPVFDDKTRVTGGLRYTVDHRTIDGYTQLNNVTTATVDDANTDKKFTYRFAVDRKLSDDIMAYVSVTAGFKSGFYNVTQPTNPVVKPQEVLAFELGFKSELFDNRMRLNGSVFRYDFTDIQVRGNTILGPVFSNAAEARINGVDIDAELRPIQGLTIQGGLQYLDAEFTSFPNAPYFEINPAGGIRPATPSSAEAKGNDLIRAPEITASIGGQYEWAFAGGTSLVAAMNYYHNDGFFWDPQNRVEQPSYQLLNASLTWSLADSLSVMAWGKNLTRDEYFTAVDITNGVGDIYRPAAPRTYGLTLRYQF